MFVMSNLLVAFAEVLEFILTIFYWLIIVRAIVSWVNPDPFNPVVQFLYKTTEPVLAPIRRILLLNFRFGIDLSPIIAFLIIIFLKSFLVRTLIGFALRLR